ncbi:Leucine aminopeptidase 2, chloroplastic [Hordeum vulgare]|nr:Leucine aminopeptidase 2, chloroplastic [Hordeum vulgare]
MTVPQPGGGEVAGQFQEHRAHDWADVTGGAVRYNIKDLGMALEVGDGQEEEANVLPGVFQFFLPSAIIDLATLTGACVVALGPSIAGIFTPSDELAEELTAASELSGEKFWKLPMEESYWEQMKSGVADMFVDEKVERMHIDMAGPVWNDKKHDATGFGVSTLVEWVLKNSSSS